MAPPERGSAHPITAHYSFIDLERMKGSVGLDGRPCSGRFTHISGHPSSAGRAWDRESSPVKDRRSTTVPRNQQKHSLCQIFHSVNTRKHRRRDKNNTNLMDRQTNW